ncbi:MAG: hypothetical protein IJ481_01785 [Alphaproteobacteria bacterium]|nr:hypothetical protein [Alphaproteobacteria bacterium]
MKKYITKISLINAVFFAFVLNASENANNENGPDNVTASDVLQKLAGNGMKDNKKQEENKTSTKSEEGEEQSKDKSKPENTDNGDEKKVDEGSKDEKDSKQESVDVKQESVQDTNLQKQDSITQQNYTENQSGEFVFLMPEGRGEDSSILIPPSGTNFPKELENRWVYITPKKNIDEAQKQIQGQKDSPNTLSQQNNQQQPDNNKAEELIMRAASPFAEQIIGKQNMTTLNQSIDGNNQNKDFADQQFPQNGFSSLPKLNSNNQSENQYEGKKDQGSVELKCYIVSK